MKRRVLGRKLGFTLIELLVVMSIIGILSAILLPVYARTRERAKRNTCMSNLRQIALGMAMYSEDYDGFTPSQPPTSAATGPCTLDGPTEMKTALGANYFVADMMADYIPTRAVFSCPSGRQVTKPDCATPQYFYCAPQAMMAQGPNNAPGYGDPSSVWLVCDSHSSLRGSNHTPHYSKMPSYYLNVAFLDGHVRGRLFTDDEVKQYDPLHTGEFGSVAALGR